MKLCSRLLMFLVEIYARNVKFGYLNPILWKLGVMHNLDWWLVGKPMVSSPESFFAVLWFRTSEANVSSSTVFAKQF